MATRPALVFVCCCLLLAYAAAARVLDEGEPFGRLKNAARRLRDGEPFGGRKDPADPDHSPGSRPRATSHDFQFLRILSTDTTLCALFPCRLTRDSALPAVHRHLADHANHTRRRQLLPAFARHRHFPDHTDSSRR